MTLQRLRMGHQWGWGRRILFGVLIGLGVWISSTLAGHVDRFWPVLAFIICWNAAILAGFALTERPRRAPSASALD